MVRTPLLLYLLLHLLLAMSSGAHAAGDARKTIPEACRSVKKLAVPEDQMPSMKDRDKLQSCSSEALYYGIGKSADPLMARHCAVLEEELRSEAVFAGNAILMMVYANGNGAAQDYDLALHFACEVGGAPAEVEGRVAHLVKLKTESVPDPNFDFCDDITSGFMQGHCASHLARMAKPKADKMAAELREKLSPPEQRAYDELQTAANNYFFSRSREEVDLSGTARAMFITEEEANLKKSLVDTLAKLNGGLVPEAEPKASTEADRALNATYAKLKGAQDIGGGTVSFEGIQKTQKLWLKYRDAWVTYAKAKQPMLSKFAVLKWQTEQREKMLAEFVRQMKPANK